MLYVSAPYKIVSADVYFSGSDVQHGAIHSNSLDAVSSMLRRSGPGTNIVFDNIKISDGKRIYYAESIKFIVKK